MQKNNSPILVFTILFLYLGIYGCQKDDDVQLLRQDAEIGDYFLREPSYKQVPYFGKSLAIFGNSLGDTLHFKIHHNSSPNLIPSSVIEFDVNEIGDSITTKYRAERMDFTILSNTAQTEFHINLRVVPSTTDPSPENAVDLLDIYYKPDNSLLFGHNIFRWVVDHREHQGINRDLSAEAPLGVNDTVYLRAIASPITEPHIETYYSLTDGIIAFQNNDSIWWNLVLLK